MSEQSDPSERSFEVLIDGWRETIAIRISEGRPQVRLCNEPVNLDVVRISENVYSLILDGRSHHVVVTAGNNSLWVIVNGARFFQAVILDPKELRNQGPGLKTSDGPSAVLAPMPGKIVRLLVAVGESVQEGQGVVVIEAMKMQNELRALKAGIIERISVVENQTVNAGDSLVVVR
jgi:biotin carboxyl carrier protein